eukprot:6200316-Pleurochrysis_carterae.AAC.3
MAGGATIECRRLGSKQKTADSTAVAWNYSKRSWECNATVVVDVAGVREGDNSLTLQISQRNFSFTLALAHAYGHARPLNASSKMARARRPLYAQRRA